MAAIFEILNSLEEEVNELARSPGTVRAEEYPRILSTLRKMQSQIETHHDTQQRVMAWPMDAGITRTCLDLGLFKVLTGSECAISLSTLAERTGVDSTLLRRLLRHQASVYHLTEIEVDVFEANNITRNLAEPVVEGTILFSHSVGALAATGLSEFLAKRSWSNPQNPKDAPFNTALGTSLSFWAYIGQNEVLNKQFRLNMESHRTIAGSCFEDHNIAADIEPCSNERAVFVDVGGGAGGQCLELLQRYPQIQGRIILQEQAHVVQALQLPTRIEVMAHDFFTPQPISGAKVYFLRAVLHDHPDEQATEIVRQIAYKMEPDSVLILSELVVPSTGASTLVTQSDISMMLYFSTAERLEGQWKALLKDAGLRLISCDYSPKGFGLGLLKAVK